MSVTSASFQLQKSTPRRKMAEDYNNEMVVKHLWMLTSPRPWHFQMMMERTVEQSLPMMRFLLTEQASLLGSLSRSYGKNVA